MPVPQLSRGFFERWGTGEHPEKPVLQVAGAWNEQNTLRFRLSDGEHAFEKCFTNKDLREKVANDCLNIGHSIIRILAYENFQIAQQQTLLINSYEVLAKGLALQGNPAPFNKVISIPRKLGASNTATSSLMDAARGAPMHQAPATAQRAPSHAAGGQNILPISMISPYSMQKARICGMVTAKEEIRDIKSVKGEMRVFNFEVTDQEGKSIRIAAFQDAADKFFDLVQKGESVYVSNFTVRQANKRFNTTGHDYELSLRNESEVQACRDQFVIATPKVVYNFIPLSQIAQHVDQCVDVLAIIDQVDETATVTARATGQMLVKRTVHLVDRQSMVQFTLWGQEATAAFDANKASEVIAIKGANVREWNGTYSLSGISGTKWEFNPKVDETNALVNGLYDWYARERATANLQQISGGGGKNVRELRAIGPAVALSLGKNEEKGDYFNVCAYLSQVKVDSALYQGCLNAGCKKKVVNSDGRYRCEKCDQTFDHYRPILMLQAEIGDMAGTGTHWVTVFDEQACKLLGHTAEQLDQLKENDRDAYDAVFKAAYFKPHCFRLRAKSEMYNDEERIKWGVYDVKPMPYDAYVEELQVVIKAFEGLAR